MDGDLNFRNEGRLATTDGRIVFGGIVLSHQTPNESHSLVVDCGQHRAVRVNVQMLNGCIRLREELLVVVSS